ncbi:MAG TPA: hypothetical protein VM598_10635, partial [Bdellovibrionota bacterium]|nr:hypothetical protein [Bdellovibrionota bacterium]
TVGDAELRTMVKMLRRMADLWEERFHNPHFVVVFTPGMKAIRPLLKQYLDAMKIPYVDYGLIKIHEKIAGNAKISEYEGHPSPAVYEFLARHIVADLGLRR